MALMISRGPSPSLPRQSVGAAFAAPERIARARLYITGLGYYEASINGRRVGDQVLDLGWTNYEKGVFYSVYDVTGLVRAGLNCIGITLGNGWWNPLPLRMCVDGRINMYSLWRDKNVHFWRGLLER
jgi:hypothetical protein